MSYKDVYSPGSACFNSVQNWCQVLTLSACAPIAGREDPPALAGDLPVDEGMLWQISPMQGAQLTFPKLALIFNCIPPSRVPPYFLFFSAGIKRLSGLTNQPFNIK